MKDKTVWTYVVTATNVINDSIEVDTNLAPFYVTVVADNVTDNVDIECEATNRAIKQANEVWGSMWYNLEIRWISENWGDGDSHAYNPNHWTQKQTVSTITEELV